MVLKKLDDFTKKVSDLPDKPNSQMNPAEVKKYFDAPADEVRMALNQLIEDLKLSTVGDSGALNVGVSNIAGVDGDTVQAVMESLKILLDKKTSLSGNHEGTWQGLNPKNFEGGQQAIDLESHKNDNVAHIRYATTTGTDNAYAVTLNPAPSSYVDGMAIAIKIHADSTAPATLNVNGLGAKPLKTSYGRDLTGLKANGIYTLRYNGVNFIAQGEGGDPTELITSINAILGA